jgi:hypothetical protein
MKYLFHLSIACAALEEKNGVLRGNMKAVGSRVEIACDKLFKDISGKTHAVCQSNGSWTHYPNCTLGKYCLFRCMQKKTRSIFKKRYSLWMSFYLKEPYLSNWSLIKSIFQKKAWKWQHFVDSKYPNQQFCNSPGNNRKKP